MAKFGIIVMLLLVWVAGAIAQTGTYRLKPDDVLVIAVYGESQITSQIPVGPDGNISAPFVGVLHAEGRTTSDIEADLLRLYKEKLQLRNPKVSVTIFKYRSVRATVSGAVNRPGTYEMRPGDTIMALLGFGGSPVVDRAIIRRATFRRAKSQEIIPVDLQAMQNGDASQDYEIEDGDVLTVPDDVTSGISNTIMIGGAVQSTGTFPYREGMRVMDALSLGRGDIPGRSKVSEIYVIRPQKGQPGYYSRIRSNFVNFLKKGIAADNMELQPGDLVYVSWNKAPSITEVSAFVNSAFFIQRLFDEGIFGFRLFR
jgi:polysaccharide export outer membrane protein